MYLIRVIWSRMAKRQLIIGKPAPHLRIIQHLALLSNLQKLLNQLFALGIVDPQRCFIIGGEFPGEPAVNLAARLRVLVDDGDSRTPTAEFYRWQPFLPAPFLR